MESRGFGLRGGCSVPCKTVKTLKTKPKASVIQPRGTPSNVVS